MDISRIMYLVSAAVILISAVPAKAFEAEKYTARINAVLSRVDEVVARGPYSADFEDLGKHDALPEWFQDAKFGIYWHWGVYSVPAFGNEWYGKHMHRRKGRKKGRVYEHHVKTYGSTKDFPYHKFVPMFKAEKFDADEWADILARSGARYAGPVAEHHDGFSMWASELTPWNVGDRGPKRDITGELAKAIRERQMRFVATFHHAHNGVGFFPVEDPDDATASDDPELQMLYGKQGIEAFIKLWEGKLAEVVDKYQPDLVWFDSWLNRMPELNRARFGAYYFNRAEQWDRDVVITRKQNDLPLTWSVEDFEKGRAAEIREDGFLTDDTVSKGSWGYTDGLEIKTANEVIDTFIDIVSKNGCLLLNISPKSDGTIPLNQQEVLTNIGEWLDVNGESIFATRPWEIFGEGPTRLRRGGHFVRMTGGYKTGDVRFTRSKDGKILYAIALGAPETKLKLNTVNFAHDDGAVELLGHGKVGFSVKNKKITVDVPAKMPTDWAHAFKFEGFEFSLDPEAETTPPLDAATLSTDTVLTATEAGLLGRGIRKERRTASENLGFWDNAGDKAFWKVQIGKPGTYDVEATVASTSKSRLCVEIKGGKSITAEIPETGSWTKQQKINLGRITIDKAGVCQLIARPVDRKTWNAINLWKIELKASE